MSHYNAIATKIKDPDLIIDALKSMGLAGVYHEEPVEMIGWGETRSRAHIVVPWIDLRPGHSDQSYLSYDLGFLRGADGTYSLVIEDLDAADYSYRRDRSFHSAFMIQYGLSAVRQAMPGLEITDTRVMPDGSLQCCFEVEVSAEVAQTVSVGV